MQPPVRICFVCSGNICRSPTAEVVTAELARAAGLDQIVAPDSAGTGSWHVGDDMDRRSRRALHENGYLPRRHVAKQFDASLFAERDLVVALDAEHRDTLVALADETDDPDAARAKIVRLREFDPALEPGEEPDVADPYYGGARGFAEVLAQIERSCRELLAEIEHAVKTGAEQLQQTDRPPP